MERMVEEMGVFTVTALVAVVVVIYAFWGATVLHSSHSPLSQSSAQPISANLK